MFVRYQIVKVSKYGLKLFDNRSYNPYIINLYCVMFMVIYNHLVKVNQWRKLKMSFIYYILLYILYNKKNKTETKKKMKTKIEIF